MFNQNRNDEHPNEKLMHAITSGFQISIAALTKASARAALAPAETIGENGLCEFFVQTLRRAVDKQPAKVGCRT
ncbi:hypothetical protein EVAR_85815_1 [Eumeta japonica]|uniref:Uncharacterized protein n=1 Tax=Eumeta variegata TaxID=151549 RepID=A0A4C1URL5_EUMVA|nr:hypothetical protein EVAR_85815_1 [Eumeta japonica]